MSTGTAERTRTRVAGSDARAEAARRRRMRASFYHWQERDLRRQLGLYLGAVEAGTSGREHTRLCLAMIRNELRRRQDGPF